MNQKVSTRLAVVIILIVAVTVGVFVWKWEKNRVGEQINVNIKNDITVKNKRRQEKTPPSTTSTDASRSFQYEKNVGFYGTLTLTGYIDMKLKICKPEDMCSKTVNYAYFMISSTDNKTIYDFINDNNGNSYVENNGIGIGCYEKNLNRIYSENNGDDKKFENIIGGNDLQILLRSNKDNPVKLQMIKPVFTSGGGAPECYSHFRQFKVNP